MAKKPLTLPDIAEKIADILGADTEEGQELADMIRDFAEDTDSEDAKVFTDALRHLADNDRYKNNA